MAQFEALNSSSLQSLIADAQRPLLVDFWAPWCGPCRTQAAILERAAAQLSSAVRIAQVNVDDEPQLARQLGITGIPTLLLFRAGQRVDSRVGVQSETALKQWLTATATPAQA